MLKVRQMTNDECRGIMNHFIMEDDTKTVFQSYDSIVAIWEDRKLTLGHDWDYNKTTMKHLNRFIREETTLYINGAKEIRKAIENGIIKYNAKLV